MSMYTPIQFACPNCGEMNEFDVFSSVNADRRPDLRDDIIYGEFMRVKCSSCETDFRPEPDFNYLDFENGLWILAKPLGWVAHWADLESEAQDVAAFLMWAAEPKMMARKQAGFVGVLFLTILSVLLYLTNKRIWAPVKARAKE